jgi:hypothetical protein
VVVYFAVMRNKFCRLAAGAGEELGGALREKRRIFPVWLPDRKDRGGLASPVTPQEAENATLRDREVKAVYAIDHTLPLSDTLNRYGSIC